MLPGYYDSLPLISRLTMPDPVSGDRVPLELWPDQRRLLDLIHTSRFVWILKRRQALATTLISLDSICQAATQKSPYTTIIVSLGERESVENLAKGKAVWESMPQKVREKNFPYSKNTTQELVFGHTGGRLLSLPKLAGSGFTARRVIIDEAFKLSNVGDFDRIRRALIPTIGATDGQIIYLGTAEGINRASDLYFEAQNGQSEYKAFFLGYFSTPGSSQASWDQLAAANGLDDTMQEYPRTPEEAFLSSGRGRFDAKTLSAMPTYQLPILNRKFASYLLSADVAEGLERGDWSVLKVFDRSDSTQVFEARGHWEPREFAHIIAARAHEYNDAVIAVERNNHGHSVLQELIHHCEYPVDKIFRHDLLGFDDAAKEFTAPDSRYGWRTTAQSKPLMIDTLAVALISGKVRGLTAEDVAELQTYTVDAHGRTNAAPGKHDDRVIALAIANYLMGNAMFNNAFPITPVPSADKTLMEKDIERAVEKALEQNEEPNEVEYEDEEELSDLIAEFF